MSHIQVLLSTYNGEPYLDPLLDSLYRQTHPAVSILARDDESTDGTVPVLRRHAASGRLKYYTGPHLGVRRSFFHLLVQADPSARLFAFCDQDDVWMPDKLARADAALRAVKDDRPLLYCARAVLVDERLRPFGLTRRSPRGPSFHNALVENIAAGCTMVLNPAARALLIRHDPGCAVLHDSWAYLVVAALGRVVYDERPAVLYRQHAGNTLGARVPRWKWWLAPGRVRRAGQDRRLLLQQAAELERFWGPALDPDTRRVLDRFLRGRSRPLSALAYALRRDVHRQGAIDDFILRVLLALRQV